MPLITTRSAASVRGLGFCQQTGPRTSPISGYELWLDAADATKFTYSSGSVVSRWTDKSANGYFFEPSATTMAPSRTGTQNSKSTLIFDGVNDGLLSTSATSVWKFLHDGTQNTVFLVYKDTTTPSTTPITRTMLNTTGYTYDSITAGYPGYRSVTGSFISGGTTFGTNYSYIYDSVIKSGQSYPANINAGSFPTTTPGAWGIITDLSDVNNATNSLRLTRYSNNSGYPNTANSYNLGWTAGSTSSPLTPLSIGRINNAGDYDAFKGEIAEIIMYKRKLSDSEKDEMVTYLKTKWNI